MKIQSAKSYMLMSRFGDRRSLVDTDSLADMLRYDTAFVSEGGQVVMFISFWRGPKGKATLDRWKTFGVTLDLPMNHKGEDFSSGQDHWYTYQHPVDADGRTDYGKLEKVYLSKFLASKDLDEVRGRK